MNSCLFQVWSAMTGKCLRTLVGHTGEETERFVDLKYEAFLTSISVMLYPKCFHQGAFGAVRWQTM